MKPKVVVAMSGGVDSSVAAALLIRQGYEVTGMMLKLWSGDCEQAENACCTPESMAQARQVASQLGIPFYVIDAKEDFKHLVVDTFIQGYESGMTPNPCFACNLTIKWGFLLEKARQSGADFLATGHYARIILDEKGNAHLHKSADLRKDQSYVLAGLNQSQLINTLLPLGDLEKTEVRRLAASFGFESANRPDSQDLCFIGNQGYRAFLDTYGMVKNLPGPIRDTLGNILGTHIGLQDYTIGQRKRLVSGSREPLYVLEKESNSNTLIVGSKDDLGFSSITLRSVNWIQGIQPSMNSDYSVKIRYKATPVACKMKEIEKDQFIFEFPEKVRDATPGQIAVLYDGDEVIGSGIIESTQRSF